MKLYAFKVGAICKFIKFYCINSVLGLYFVFVRMCMCVYVCVCVCVCACVLILCIIADSVFAINLLRQYVNKRAAELNKTLEKKRR